MCGHPFPHHHVGVILKGPEPSPRRFPSDVKRFWLVLYITLLSSTCNFIIKYSVKLVLHVISLLSII